MNSTSALAEYQENQVEAEQMFSQSLESAASQPNESLTDMEIVVDTADADINDFLTVQAQRPHHIKKIQDRMAQREKQHLQAIHEQTELHAHAQGKDAELLKQLGHVEAPAWVETNKPSKWGTGELDSPEVETLRAKAFAAAFDPPMRRGRPAGAKNAAKSATPVETATPKRTYTRKAVSVAPVTDPAPTDKPKRKLSAATKKRMAAAHRARWAAKKAATEK